MGFSFSKITFLAVLGLPCCLSEASVFSRPIMPAIQARIAGVEGELTILQASCPVVLKVLAWGSSLYAGAGFLPLVGSAGLNVLEFVRWPAFQASSSDDDGKRIRRLFSEPELSHQLVRQVTTLISQMRKAVAEAASVPPRKVVLVGGAIEAEMGIEQRKMTRVERPPVLPGHATETREIIFYEKIPFYRTTRLHADFETPTRFPQQDFEADWDGELRVRRLP